MNRAFSTLVPYDTFQADPERPINVLHARAGSPDKREVKLTLTDVSGIPTTPQEATHVRVTLMAQDPTS